MQARQRDIHPSVFERAYLGAVKAREIGELVLGPTAFHPQSPDSRAKPPLNLFALQ
jgi:hypothetical protein